VLCFDGTGDQFDDDNSNIVQLFSLLQKDDHTQQMVYYQSGIGTYTIPQIATPFYSKLAETIDLAVAISLDAHVMDGYAFLMENYQLGDKICLFGFSRGAYTARSLAGMVQKVGVLPACNHRQVPFAYKMYKSTDNDGWKQSVAFKKAFAIDVDIEFVGVWDTVSSVGLIPKRLPFVSSNSAIRYFRHALSLDERRAKFKANHYNRPSDEANNLGVKLGDMPKSAVPTSSRFLNIVPPKRTKSQAEREEEQQDSEEAQFDIQDTHSLDTDILEVWFAGCHCDVGGGSVPNGTRYNLARIPLRWMIRQCFLAKTGIRFHSSLFESVGLDYSTLYPVVLDRPEPLFELPADYNRDIKGHKRSDTEISTQTLVNPESAPQSLAFLSEEIEDLLDARATIYDQLTLAKFWWILEYLPMTQRFQKTDHSKQWVEELTINNGRGRVVPPPTKALPFNVHRTVQIRKAAKDLPGGEYKTNARIIFEGEPNYVA